jgi:hypothetical protein
MVLNPGNPASYTWVLSRWNSIIINANPQKYNRLLKKRRARYLFIRKTQKAMLDKFDVEAGDLEVLLFLALYMVCKAGSSNPRHRILDSHHRRAVECFEGDDDNFGLCWEEFVEMTTLCRFNLNNLDLLAPGTDDEEVESDLEEALAQVLADESASAAQADP